MPADHNRHLWQRSPLDQAGFDFFLERFRLWLDRLQLRHWDWEATRFIHDETYNAAVNVKPNERRFTLDVSDSWTGGVDTGALDRIACHEALHLVTYELWEVGREHCPPALTAHCERLEHHLICTLENALCGPRTRWHDLRGEAVAALPYAPVDYPQLHEAVVNERKKVVPPAFVRSDQWGDGEKNRSEN